MLQFFMGRIYEIVCIISLLYLYIPLSLLLVLLLALLSLASWPPSASVSAASSPPSSLVVVVGCCLLVASFYFKRFYSRLLLLCGCSFVHCSTLLNWILGTEHRSLNDIQPLRSLFNTAAGVESKSGNRNGGIYIWMISALGVCVWNKNDGSRTSCTNHQRLNLYS